MRKAVLRITALVLTAFCLLGSAATAKAAEPSLEELVADFLAEYKLNEKNFSFAYYNTVTGEAIAFNEDKLMVGASLYKLPMCMYYYELEAAGEISADEKFAGYPLSDCYQLSLEYSHNEISAAMQRGLGSYTEYKTKLAKYAGVTVEELGAAYLGGNYFSAKTMLNTLKYLYDNAEFFAEAIEYLKAAQPEEYFKTYVQDYEIAQKYGWLYPIVNCVGIVYTPTPYLLSVFTDGTSWGENVVARLNELLCDYTVSRNAASDVFSEARIHVRYVDYASLGDELRALFGRRIVLRSKLFLP